MVAINLYAVDVRKKSKMVQYSIFTTYEEAFKLYKSFVDDFEGSDTFSKYSVYLKKSTNDLTGDLVRWTIKLSWNAQSQESYDKVITN